MTYRLIDDEEEVHSAIKKYPYQFPISSLRLLKLPYYRQVHGYETSQMSFLVTHEEDPICVLLNASRTGNWNYFDMPALLEIAPTKIGPANTKELGRLVRRRLLQTQGSLNPSKVSLYSKKTFPTMVARELLLGSRTCHFSAISEIDLSRTLPEITSSMSEQTRRHISRAQGVYDRVETFTSEAPMEILDAFRDLHFRAAGRITRKDGSWLAMWDALSQSAAVLSVGYRTESLVAATYCWTSIAASEYGTGAYDRDLFPEMPVSHLVLFQCINAAKGLGCKYFYVGEAFGSGKTSKEKQIERYKMSFSSEIGSMHIFELI